MEADALPFAGPERAGLVPDGVGDAEPAEPLHERGPMQVGTLIGVETECSAAA